MTSDNVVEIAELGATDLYYEDRKISLKQYKELEID